MLVAALLACDGGESNPAAPSALGEPAGVVGRPAAVAGVGPASPVASVASEGGDGGGPAAVAAVGSASPAASAASAGVGGRVAGVADPGLPRGGVGLKAKPPVLQSPADEATVDALTVQLVVGQVEAVEAVKAVISGEAFSVRFEVWAQPYRSGADPLHEREVSGVRYTVPDGVLADRAGYFWRAQAVFGEENGPWSELRAFRVDLPKIGVPGLRTPADGMELATLRPTLTVSSPSVSGNVGDVVIEFQVASNRNFTGSVTSGRAPRPGSGDVTLMIAEELATATRYYWRARGVSDRVTGGWSAVRSFRTPAAVTWVPPTPVTPAEGATTDGLRPTFRVNNPTVTGIGDTVFIELQIARNREFNPVDVPIRESARSRGNTDLQSPRDLNAGTRYFWRSRGAAGSRTSRWSAVRSFRTPASGGGSPGGGGIGSSPNAPFTTSGGSPPNMRHVVEQVAREYPRDLANSCPEEGGNWNFLDRVVERLRAIDGRWGYNCKRGDCRHVSVDVVDYYRGRGTSRSAAQNSTDVAIIDIISKVCGAGANPSPTWIDQTEVTREHGAIGRWRYPR